jgi:glycerol kinase
MQNDSGIKISELRVDGGATVNNQLLQFQSDLLQSAVVRPVVTETTALGAAYLAGLAVKYWDNIDELSKQWKIERTFSPRMNRDQISEMVKGWKRAVKAAKSWAENE